MRCRECEYVLYSGSFMTGEGRYFHGSITQKVSRIHNGKCPSCGRALKPSEARVIEVGAADEPTPEFESPFRKKKRRGKKMNLNESIIALLREHRGEISRSKVQKYFSDYSKGYIYKRLRALKRSGLMIELGDRRGVYVLTERGWNVTIPELQQMNLKKKREEVKADSI